MPKSGDKLDLRPLRLSWALTYPVDLAARTVLACMCQRKTGDRAATTIATDLNIPRRTAEDAIRRLKNAGAIRGKRGKYRLLLPRKLTTSGRGTKRKKLLQIHKTPSVDNIPAWWRILTSLAIDKRKGHVGLEPDNLPLMTRWIKRNKLTADQAEQAADKVAARWPINQQRVVFRIFYTYCRYELRDRDNGRTHQDDQIDDKRSDDYYEEYLKRQKERGL